MIKAEYRRTGYGAEAVAVFLAPAYQYLFPLDMPVGVRVGGVYWGAESAFDGLSPTEEAEAIERAATDIADRMREATFNAVVSALMPDERMRRAAQ